MADPAHVSVGSSDPEDEENSLVWIVKTVHRLLRAGYADVWDWTYARLNFAVRDLSDSEDQDALLKGMIARQAMTDSKGVEQFNRLFGAVKRDEEEGDD